MNLRMPIYLFLGMALTFSSQADTTGELFLTINQRLSIMQFVARYKAENKIAVEDLLREQEVMESSKQEAAAAGLDQDSVESFFQAQIAVAKAVQYRHLADLPSQTDASPTTDLDSVIRPELDALGTRIVQLLANRIKTEGNLTADNFADFEASISEGYVTAGDKRLLFDALQQVRTR